MGKVYVIQKPMKRDGSRVKPAFDFSAAEKYGEIEVLAPNGRNVIATPELRDSIFERLKRFDPAEDYIIPVGDYALIFMIGLVLGERFGKVRILRWVPGAEAYRPMLLNYQEMITDVC